MFELSVALKYLIPRRRQLSVSIISMISVLVIALVVWLILLFFSVKNGLEKVWIEKLTALTAPIRITPTDAYFNSYYYLSDTISSNSQFTPKSIAEKRVSEVADPYNPERDEEVPTSWPKADRNADGSLKDLVKLAFQEIEKSMTGLHSKEFEVAFGNLELKLVRGKGANATQSIMNHSVYLGSFDGENEQFNRTLLTQEEQNKTWIHKEGSQYLLPRHPQWGEGILLPKNFKEAGVMLGDRGKILYYGPTASSVQEQQIPVYVAGFFDQGIMPIGGKFLLIHPEIVSLLRSNYEMNDQSMGTGINVRFDSIAQADPIKKLLTQRFEQAGIAPYWKIETYNEFEFSKELIQQLNSEKNIFGLISMVIILVACSNIVSMLIILVNDKKMEIGILRAMGATSFSIACIFGLCGTVMGFLGSVMGIGLALLTLHYLNPLMQFLGQVQGHQVFNTHFYGDSLPNELSFEALLFVLLATVMISLISGIIPAVKASLMRPSAILRSE